MTSPYESRRGGLGYALEFRDGRVIVRWEVGFAPRTMTIFIMAISSAACTAAESTAGSRSVFLAVRHVAAAASETRKVYLEPQLLVP